MMKNRIFSKGLFAIGILMFTVSSCSKDNAIVTEEELTDTIELRRSAEVDLASESISDLIIDVYETEESSAQDRSASSSFLPGCVTITVVAQQGFREVTLDFGNEGCIVNGHVLKGQIVFSYTRDSEALEVLITYNLIDFFFDAKNIIGSRTILRQLSNDNGNPQFTHTLDLTVVWPNGLQASREGVKIREWIAGFGSGVFSDNVFEVTGNWTTTFVNGNTHTYEVLTPLRREVVCPYFVSGSVNVEYTNFGGVFDYGEGDCDNEATFTGNNGNVIDIVLN